jgi:gas vesicle protein
MGKSVALLLSGFGIGIGVALLAAPRSGAETRNRINSKVAEGGELLKRQTQGVRDTVTDTIRRSTDFVNKSQSAARAAVNAGIDAGKQEFTRSTATA